MDNSDPGARDVIKDNWCKENCLNWKRSAWIVKVLWNEEGVVEVWWKYGFDQGVCCLKPYVGMSESNIV